jgi:hypothetical protein
LTTFIPHRIFLLRIDAEGYHRTMKSRLLWLLLALGGSAATTAAGILLFGRITELQESGGQPTVPWTELAAEATVRHWAGITLVCGIASLVLWLFFARAWSKSSPSRSTASCYSIAVAAAILAPCVLLAVFALI